MSDDKTPHVCETCDFCLYIGEGDFICDRKDEPKLVIVNWEAIREACKKWRTHEQ